MTDNVIGFRGVALPGQPVANVVDLLKDLLARAEAGDIRGVAYAVTHDGGAYGTGWEAEYGQRNDIAAAIMALNNRYAQALGDDDE
jgi:hypothetical protein